MTITTDDINDTGDLTQYLIGPPVLPGLPLPPPRPDETLILPDFAPPPPPRDKSSVVYGTANPDRPPYEYEGRHRCPELKPIQRPARRGRKWLAAVLSVVGISLTIACGAGVDSSDAKPNDPGAAASAVGKGAAETAKKAVKKATEFGDGQYKVGTDIQAGTYTTTVPADAFGCTWERLKDFTGNPNTITAIDFLATGAKGRMTVVKTDVGVKFSGGCVWTRAAK